MVTAAHQQQPAARAWRCVAATALFLALPRAGAATGQVPLLLLHLELPAPLCAAAVPLLSCGSFSPAREANHHQPQPGGRGGAGGSKGRRPGAGSLRALTSVSRTLRSGGPALTRACGSPAGARWAHRLSVRFKPPASCGGDGTWVRRRLSRRGA